MKNTRIISAALFLKLTLGVSALGFFEAPFVAYAQQAIFIVRHADVPENLDRKDIRDDTPVSEAGLQRAAALASRLKDAGITAIYTTEALRTVQTAGPLAKAVRVDIKSVPRSDLDGLIRRLRDQHGGDKVLVVGHGETVPHILKALGYPTEIKLGRREFDKLFVIVPKSDGSPVTFRMRY